MNDRVQSIKKIITAGNLDAVLISSVPNIIYLTGYSGFSRLEREAFLIITPRENFLITDGRYSEAVSQIPRFRVLEISNAKTLENLLEKLSKKIKKIGIEENDLRMSEGEKFKKYFKLFPLKQLINLRIVKTEKEIKKIKKACKIGDEAYSFILKKIKPEITEKEIARDLETFIKSRKAEFSFPAIVAFGRNSSIPHYQTGNKKLKANSIILLDFGVKIDNYCSDMTRTIFFGKADEKFKRIYETVLEAQKRTIDFLNSSFLNPNSKTAKAVKVDKVARRYIVSQGYSTIPHSLGHGIGIEVHEPPQLSPTSQVELKPGMVFSIEPGIYLTGYGGVRIEDLVAIQNGKVKILTHSPKKLVEI